MGPEGVVGLSPTPGSHARRPRSARVETASKTWVFSRSPHDRRASFVEGMAGRIAQSSGRGEALAVRAQRFRVRPGLWRRSVQDAAELLATTTTAATTAAAATAAGGPTTGSRGELVVQFVPTTRSLARQLPKRYSRANGGDGGWTRALRGASRAALPRSRCDRHRRRERLAARVQRRLQAQRRAHQAGARRGRLNSRGYVRRLEGGSRRA